jgi:hypothetical protein
VLQPDFLNRSSPSFAAVESFCEKELVEKRTAKNITNNKREKQLLELVRDMFKFVLSIILGHAS